MSANPLTALLDQLATVLNRNVAQSQRTSTLVTQLEGRVLALALEGTPITLFFKVSSGRVTIDSRHEGTTDARLAGTPARRSACFRGPGPARQTACAVPAAGSRATPRSHSGSRTCCSRRSRTSRKNCRA
ncbi:MAG: hypothetical protein K0R70_1662 [Steroidobacteraceae bacterium]|nr:hypothetical protein [Steroidobacteraceae bacterium]